MNVFVSCLNLLGLAFLVLTVHTLGPVWVLGQGSPPSPITPETVETLSLLRAVDLALRHHPRIKGSDSGARLAEAQLGEARAGRLPQLQFDLGYTNSNNPVFVFGSLLEQGRFGPDNFAISSLNQPAALNNFRSGLRLKLPVFDGLQTGTRIARASLGREQARQRSVLAEQQVRFEVIRTYFGVLLAEARQGVALETVRSSEAEAQRIRHLLEAGLVVESDLLAAEVQLAEFRQQQIQSRGEAIVARAALNAALGRDESGTPGIEGHLKERHFELTDVQEWIGLALTARPELIDADLRLQASAEGLRGARGQFLPRLELFGNYGGSGRNLSSGSSDYSVGALLSLDLVDFGRRNRIGQAQAAEAQASADKELMTRRVRLEVIQAYQQFLSAREQLKVVQGALRQAEATLRIVQDRYREGLTTITEMLRAETASSRSRMSLLSARYRHVLGYAKLLLSSGQLENVQGFGP